MPPYNTEKLDICTVEDIADYVKSYGNMDEFQKSLLDTHNKFRAYHGVPPLVWSAELTKDAQEWVDKLAREEIFKHATVKERKRQGENLAYGFKESLTGEQATSNWYSEIKDYDFDTVHELDVKTGHFTQVVWRSTKEIGAGYATTISGKHYIVARYFPSGNKKEAFVENVFPFGGMIDTVDGEEHNELREQRRVEKRNEEIQNKISLPHVFADVPYNGDKVHLQYSFHEYIENNNTTKLQCNTVEVYLSHMPKPATRHVDEYLKPGKTYTVSHFLYK